METFIEARGLVDNPEYPDQRGRALSKIDYSQIDAPIVGLICRLNDIGHCFTLQCCYGHFIYSERQNEDSLDRLPATDKISRVEYRIAYLACCVENSEAGRKLMDDLKGIPAIDRENVQFCSAEWFWERQVNSYALQVEPDRFKREDKAILDYEEALKIEKVRDEFFDRLSELLP
jgi:hypothetical protein